MCEATAQCRDSIQWCTVEKRAFLRQRVQSKLASLLLKTKDYTNCNALLSELLSEVCTLHSIAFLS